MNYLLSYGGGVNSTAMILLMEDTCEFQEIFQELHIVFADTGVEHPETYAYLDTMDAYLSDREQRLVRVAPEKSLLEMCKERNFLPSRMSRWCTKEVKLNPLWKYEAQVFTLNPKSEKVQLMRFIGIDAGESHRVRVSGYRHIKQRYPLIKYDLDRTACIRLIERRGLPVPKKSGCYFCPFSSRHELARLSIEYPQLFDEALRLEQSVNEAWSERKEPFHLIQGLPLEVLRQKRDEIIARYESKKLKKEMQPGLFDSLEAEELEEKLDSLPCLCGR
ncbi:phosphoadenosine phosphosulfate reductase family protein [Candidatus Poribacteria bacterium]|nr:phosphoadenosine phosphosulfate reductase family protein [Candidatus Poribacteria bacterium]